MGAIFEKIKSHKIAIIFLAILSLGGYYYWSKYINIAPAETRYVLAKVERGTLVSSISGSGQVSSSDQVDIKPKVSGDLVRVNAEGEQEVKAGTILAQIDSRDAQRAISDAEIALEAANIKLEELLAPLDAQTLLQKENAMSQAERDLEKAQKTYENIGPDTETMLAKTYENGYSEVSASLFNLSDYMADLKAVNGTEKSEQECIVSYKAILGEDSLFIQKFLEDYSRTMDLYNKNVVSFRGVFRDDKREVIYKIIKDTLETARAINESLESARHMYDAIASQGYSKYYIATTIDKMKPKVESDLAASFSTINTLQNTIDTIDSTVEDGPDKIKDAELAFNSAKENLSEKKLALEEFKKGADALDIRTQQNVVAQKEAALTDAKEKLADYAVRAPFDGIIIKVNVKKGDAVSSGTALATIVTKQKIVKIILNEIDVVKIKIGQKATVAFDAIEGFTVAGKVAEIDTIGTVTQGVVTYNVKIVFDTQDERVKAGMSVSVAIISDVKQDVLLAPNGAIKSQGQRNYVEMLGSALVASQSNPGFAAGIVSAAPPIEQAIEIGLANDSDTEITSGLKEGDWIVARTISAETAAAPATTTSSRQSGGLGIPGLGGFGR